MANGTLGVTLHGRLFIRGAVEVVTGLHIGGAAGALAIGSVDNPIVRDPLTGRPYLPGSSLKGKLRSLAERAVGAEQNQGIGRGVQIHVCTSAASYASCRVCPVFGTLGQMDFSRPTRLLVRDALLSDASAEQLARARTDLPFAEVKWEAAIDRVTSAATPRQIERVPAGSVFEPFELVYSVYRAEDFALFRWFIGMLKLLEDDYLGGLGSRGGGKVRFRDLRLLGKATDGYELAESLREVREFGLLDDLLDNLEEVVAWLGREVPVATG